MSLANGSADPVLFAARLWESCAVPSILYASESLLVRSNELNKCKSEQSSLAKFILQVPTLLPCSHMGTEIFI